MTDPLFVSIFINLLLIHAVFFGLLALFLHLRNKTRACITHTGSKCKIILYPPFSLGIGQSEEHITVEFSDPPNYEKQFSSLTGKWEETKKELLAIVPLKELQKTAVYKTMTERAQHQRRIDYLEQQIRNHKEASRTLEEVNNKEWTPSNSTTNTD